MPGLLGGQNLRFVLGGQDLDGYLGGVQQFGQSEASTTVFTLANAGISFSVAQSGIVSLSISTGTLEGTNYSNGQNLGTVSSNTTRTLTGNVRVPNDSSVWTNAGQTVSITGISAQQSATLSNYTTTQAESNISFTVSKPGIVSISITGGPLNDANYTNGQNLGTVAVNTVRTLTGDYVVPSGYLNTGSTVPVSIDTTQIFTETAFAFGDINTNNVLSINRRTGVLSGVGSFASGFTDAEGNALNFSLTLASGQTSAFPVIAFGGSSVIQSVSVVITGETPEGYLSEGTSFSLQGSVSVTQLATDVAPAVPATAAVLSDSGEYEAEAGDRVDITVTITPDSNGEWNVTSSSSDVTFSGVSGVGSDNFTANVSSTWNGSIIRFTIRSGSSSTGAILANGQITGTI